jgi:uncharacterized protein YoxC
MIGVVWALAVVSMIAIIMYGIYRTARIFDDNTLKLREVTRERDRLVNDSMDLMTKVKRLEAELEREKARIHEADDA